MALPPPREMDFGSVSVRGARVDSLRNFEYALLIASRSEHTQAPVLAKAGDRGRGSANGGRALGGGDLDPPCSLAERKEVIQ